MTPISLPVSRGLRYMARIAGVVATQNRKVNGVTVTNPGAVEHEFLPGVAVVDVFAEAPEADSSIREGRHSLGEYSK